jgi:hypothetical protein
MEASGPSGNTSNIPKQSIATILGTAIAVVTLTLPLITITYFASESNFNNVPATNYSFPNLRK